MWLRDRLDGLWRDEDFVGTTATSTSTGAGHLAGARSIRAGTAPTRHRRPPRHPRSWRGSPGAGTSRVRTVLGAPAPARAPGTWDFPARELRDLRVRVRAEQLTPGWKAHYSVRSGVEGTIDEFAHGHGMCHCRYRGRSQAHLQHVLTAPAVNIERLNGGAGASRSPRRSSPGRSW
ncbi:transposase [Streptomyces europaeiscabiei]|uniref:transposase n=1 Tax=Streptomyces europaeiscabiei TaxID=146819 RepID=UPI002E2890D0|nr:transposase [Streptomyces europaeiscabiei]